MGCKVVAVKEERGFPFLTAAAVLASSRVLFSPTAQTAVTFFLHLFFVAAALKKDESVCFSVLTQLFYLFKLLKADIEALLK